MLKFTFRKALDLVSRTLLYELEAVSHSYIITYTELKG